MVAACTGPRGSVKANGHGRTHENIYVQFAGSIYLNIGHPRWTAWAVPLCCPPAGNAPVVVAANGMKARKLTAQRMV